MLELEYRLVLALAVILGILLVEVILRLDVTSLLLTEVFPDDVVVLAVELALLELSFALVLVDKEGKLAAETSCTSCSAKKLSSSSTLQMEIFGSFIGQEQAYAVSLFLIGSFGRCSVSCWDAVCKAKQSKLG